MHACPAAAGVKIVLVAEESRSHEPGLRVVDRRWWARGENDQAAAESGLRKPTYVEGLEQQLAEQAAQLQSSIVERKRSLEEFEAIKARMRRDVAREVDRGKRAVLVEMLDVVDNLDRAIAAAGTTSGDGRSEGVSALLRGVELVRDQFLAKLEAFGASRIPALGQPFDARYHEAIATRSVDNPALDGFVVAVTREGFAIGDDLLRPASVVVGKLDAQA